MRGESYMKKKMLSIFLCVFCLLGLTACGDTSESTIKFSSKYVNLVIIENTSTKRVLMDEDTGVLYLWYKDGGNYGQALTPLYNADGSLKNISDFKD